MTIKDLRKKHNLTQQQLADLLDVPKRTIENWEGGKSECKQYILNLIEFKLEAIMTKKYQLYTLLMEECNHYNLTTEDFHQLEDADLLTTNKGSDGNTYYWYYDGKYNAAINIETGEIITDNDIIEDLFC